jgi:hypothetical protein
MGKSKKTVAAPESSSAAAARAAVTTSKTRIIGKKKIPSKVTKPKPQPSSGKGKGKGVATPEDLDGAEEAAIEAKRAEKKLQLEYHLGS